MLLDIRTYVCKPGTIKKHLELYEKKGKTPQTRNLGQPLLYAVCETGNPNEYTISGYMKMLEIEKEKEQPCNQTQSGLIIQMPVQN